jgi:hypothetical protein
MEKSSMIYQPIGLPSTEKTILISEAELIALQNKARHKSPTEEAIDLPDEVWNRIDDVNDYFFSNLGRVKRDVLLRNGNRQNILMKPSLYNGNLSVGLTIGSKNKVRTTVARLILMAFNPHQDQQKLFPAHLDGDVTNNKIQNLKWMTKKEFREHKTKVGHLRPYLKTKTYMNKRGKIKTRPVVFSDADLNKIKELYNLGISQKKIADMVGATQGYISLVVLNKIAHVQ